MPDSSQLPRLAVLIDADNISHQFADRLFDMVGQLGEPVIRRIFGDFSQGRAAGWKKVAGTHALDSLQLFPIVSGKNATDIALTVDAMDLLRDGGLEGFCIASSDSDYTRLATRIRESGLVVVGFGTNSAPAKYRSACHGFVELGAPIEPVKAVPIPKAKKPAVQQSPQATGKRPVTEAEALLLKALDGQGYNWIPLPHLLATVRKVAPSFASANYGHRKPVSLVRKITTLQAELHGGTMMVRRKPTAVLSAVAIKAA